MHYFLVSKVKFVLSLCLLFILFSTPIAAQTRQETVRIPADTIINHDYMASGSQVIIEGTINGDAYVFGGDVEIDGTVNGDLIAAGGNVTIKGEVTQDIRAAGGNVRIEGKVGRNISAAGGTVKVSGTDPIQGSAWLAGGNVAIEKPTHHDLNVAGGDVYIDAPVGGSLNGQLGHLEVGDQLKVGGDVTYRAQERAAIPPEASISGKVNYVELPKREETQRFIGSMTRGAFYFSLYVNLVLFLVLLLTWKILPTYSRLVIDMMTKQLGQSALVGFLFWIGLPVVTILLVITIVGIPIGIVLLLASVIAYFFATGYAAMWVGQRILSNFGYHDSLPSALVTGLIVLFVLNMVPLVNVLVSLAIALVGIGAMLKTKFVVFRTLRKENAI